MLKPEFSLFLGKSSQEVFGGFLSESNLFVIVEVEGVSKEVGNLLLATIKAEVSPSHVTDLKSFAACITNAVRKANVPLDLSLAALYIQDSTVYLKTVGSGRIFLKRRSQFAEIISNNNDAAGPAEAGDLYTLATHRFSSLFPSTDVLKKVIVSSDVYTAVDAIYEAIGEKQDDGVIALFMSPIAVKEQTEFSVDQVVTEEGTETDMLITKKPKNKLFAFWSSSGESSSKKKLLTMMIVAVLFIMLLWSVGLGYKRRTAEETSNLIKTTKQHIIQTLNQASTDYTTNPSHAKALLVTARQQLNTLQEKVGSAHKQELDVISTLIAQKEQEITRSENKTAEEFYDVTVDTKDAKINGMWVNGDIAALLDQSKKTVYLVSLSKKSLEKRIANEIKQATLAIYADSTLYIFVPQKGIFTVSSTNTVKKIIDVDKDWGSIQDMHIFNGNIYLLDPEKNDIYKYLATENGYGDKQSYFKGSKDISDARSMAIDSSIYINMQDKIEKFTSGLVSDFKTTYPDGSVLLSNLYTDENLKNLFVLDKDRGAVYLLNKNGEYLKQVQSDIIKKSSAFGVWHNTLYFLSKTSLYKINY